jgi:hypothetical protein
MAQNSLYQPTQPGYSLQYPETQPNPYYAGGDDPSTIKLEAVRKFNAARNQSATSGFPNATQGAMTGNPYIAGAGLGLDLLGKGMEIYGAAKERKAAEAEAREAEKRYQAELARRDLLDLQRQAQQRRANEMAYGSYASNMEGQAQDLYSLYR